MDDSNLDFIFMDHLLLHAPCSDVQYTNFIIDIVIYRIDFQYQLRILQWLVSIFIASAIFTTIITWIIDILSYVYIAYNVQALHSISLVHAQQACFINSFELFDNLISAFNGT